MLYEFQMYEIKQLTDKLAQKSTNTTKIKYKLLKIVVKFLSWILEPKFMTIYQAVVQTEESGPNW